MRARNAIVIALGALVLGITIGSRIEHRLVPAWCWAHLTTPTAEQFAVLRRNDTKAAQANLQMVNSLRKKIAELESLRNVSDPNVWKHPIVIGKEVK